MSADFSKLLAHIQENLEDHVKRDGLSPVRAAVFLARGGHAPGEACPSASPVAEDPHEYWCASPDLPCNCGVGDG
jgi:hypothetical protein